MLTKNGPLKAHEWKAFKENDLPITGLATSLTEEKDYEPIIEGKIPDDLQGSLFRNGPGLFDRSGLRKRMLLDGDGLVQAFHFDNAKVHYRNRFVKTKKYLNEEKAGKYLYRTWSTGTPSWLRSLIQGKNMIEYQAGVSVVERNGELYAFDEGSAPYILDPMSLETKGRSTLGTKNCVVTAHSKQDPHTKHWYHFGIEFGRQTKIGLRTLDVNNKLVDYRQIPIPNMVYMHDWAVTENYFIFILHPLELPMSKLFPFLIGMNNITDILKWKPEKGNTVMLVNKHDKNDVMTFEAKANFVWHTLNAFENDSGDIIIDYCGYDNPQLGNTNDPFFTIMRGEINEANLKSESPLIRYVITPSQKKLSEEIINDAFGYDFPIVNPRLSTHEHRFGYLVGNEKDNLLDFHRIVRIDTQTGKEFGYAFPKTHFCSEPIFAPKKGITYDPKDDSEEGYLLSLIYNSDTKRSYLSILDAAHLENGPFANVHLTHHVPLSFHGYWSEKA